MLRIIQISDTHIGPDKNYQLYGRNTYQDTRHLVDYLNHKLTFAPDFVIHTGDVTNSDDHEAGMQLAADILGELNYPISYVAGNHDGRALMRKYLLNMSVVDHPVYYDFHQDGFHFIVLDTRGPVDPQGEIDAQQLEWLSDTLQDSQAETICVFLHHLPLLMYVPWYDRDMRIMNAADLRHILKPHRDRLGGVFFGHIHRAFTGYRDGILFSAAPSAFMQFHAEPTEEQPRFNVTAQGGFSLLTLTHEQTTVSHYTLPSPKDFPRPIKEG